MGAVLSAHAAASEAKADDEDAEDDEEDDAAMYEADRASFSERTEFEFEVEDDEALDECANCAASTSALASATCAPIRAARNVSSCTSNLRSREVWWV